MLRQDYAEQTTPQPSERTTGRAQPGWRIALRRGVRGVVTRALGVCLAPTPARGVLVLLAIVGLLAVITVTLSVGNALLVLLAGVIMRVSCEYRRR
ncbi:MAG TPA: hypothetical protein VH333_10145 [Pseudonocardiaceae bacterium]|jgi:hypothetical protein|nr:hypothetical protein [Pseudonocardiaceae bacterium]